MDNKVTFQEVPRAYYTMIPNMVDDLELSPYAFRLYAHLRRVAGENGSSWQSTRTLAKKCKMSTGKVSDSKKELQHARLIMITKCRCDRGEYDDITIVDIWKENNALYRP